MCPKFPGPWKHGAWTILTAENKVLVRNNLTGFTFRSTSFVLGKKKRGKKFLHGQNGKKHTETQVSHYSVCFPVQLSFLSSAFSN